MMLRRRGRAKYAAGTDGKQTWVAHTFVDFLFKSMGFQML
jgi:hypothetical protein